MDEGTRRFRRVIRLTAAMMLLIAVAGGGYRLWQIQRRQPIELWQSAQTALQNRDDDVAEIHLRKLVTSVPENAKVRFELSKVILRQKYSAGEPATYASVPEAFDLLSQAARLEPTSVELQTLLMQAWRDMGRNAEAVAVARRLQSLSASEVEALILLIDDSLAQQDFESAGGHLMQLEAVLRPLDPRLMIRRVRLYEARDDHRARDAYLLSSSAALSQVSASELLAAEAVAPYEFASYLDALVRKPLDATVVAAGLKCSLHCLRTLSRVDSPADKQRWNAAQAAQLVMLHEARKTDIPGTAVFGPGDYTALYQIIQPGIEREDILTHLVTMLVANGDLSRALTITQDFMRTGPSSLEMELMLGELLMRNGHTAAAADRLVGTWRRSPESAAACVMAAQACSEAGRHDDAQALLARLQQSHSDEDSDSFHQVAQALLLQADALDPDSDAFRLRLVLLDRSGEYEAALDQVDRAIEAGSSSSSISQTRLFLLCRMKRWEAADALANQLASDEDSWETSLALFRTFDLANWDSAALHWGNHALRLRNAQDNELESDQIDRKLTDRLAAISLKLWIEHRLPQHLETTLAHHETLLALRPDDGDVLNVLAWLHGVDAGNADRALELSDRLVALGNELTAAQVDTVATVFRRNGRLDDALRLIDDSLRRLPDSSKLHFQKGMLLAARNNSGDVSTDATQLVRAELELALTGGLPQDRHTEAERILASIDVPDPQPGLSD